MATILTDNNISRITVCAEGLFSQCPGIGPHPGSSHNKRCSKFNMERLQIQTGVIIMKKIFMAFWLALPIAFTAISFNYALGDNAHDKTILSLIGFCFVIITIQELRIQLSTFKK